jgi:uncharacterized membrane protein
MKKIDFLNELYNYLSLLPKSERNEILDDFREHFREGEMAGKTEEQICEELGSPFECAKLYVGDAIEDNRIQPQDKKKSNKTFWTVAFFWNIFQAFFSIPITAALFLISAIMIVLYCFIVPAIGSLAFLIFAIASTSTVVCLGIITLLWTAIQIKECIKRMNK